MALRVCATHDSLPLAVKTAIEALATPLTYLAVGRLKQKERLMRDEGVNYNPFSIAQEK